MTQHSHLQRPRPFFGKTLIVAAMKPQWKERFPSEALYDSALSSSGKHRIWRQPREQRCPVVPPPCRFLPLLLGGSCRQGQERTRRMFKLASPNLSLASMISPRHSSCHLPLGTSFVSEVCFFHRSCQPALGESFYSGIKD